ncbi:MAG: dihydroorotate dehydrogenase electron transfer subunit [Acidaminococcaceae bacterium]
MSKTIVEAKVIGQKILSTDVKLIDVYAPEIAAQAQPGQFVNVCVSSQMAPLLRRPLGIAVVNVQTGVITMIYRILGEATQLLANACSGDVLSIIGPLGHGFDLTAQRPLLIGGGLGLAPLVYLAQSFCPQPVEVLMGGRTDKELFWTEIYTDLCEALHITTDDGSQGTKGTVLALLPELLQQGHYDCVYVCGPEPMMKAVAQVAQAQGVPCQVSLEKYMACGVGACLSCSCGGVHKRLKVCTDGPVFWAQEVTEW